MAAGDPVAADEEARGPYDVSPADVCALVPDFTPRVAGTAAPGKAIITNDRITAWITDVSAAVAARLHRTARITDTTVLGRVTGAAKAVVTVGAAAYVEEAAHPERASISDTTYGQVLWNRYTAGLDALVTNVDQWLDDGTATDGGTGGGGVAAYFPPARFPDCMVF